MKLEGVESPRWGPRKCQLLATPYATLSLALFALDDSDPSGGFHLRSLSIGRALDNHGAHFGYSCRIPRCRGRIVLGVGVTHKTCVYCTFLQCLQSPATLPLRLLHHGAIKLPVAPAHNLRLLTQSPIISLLRSLCKVSSLLPFI
jgi:hypothetical protein